MGVHAPVSAHTTQHFEVTDPFKLSYINITHALLTGLNEHPVLALQTSHQIVGKCLQGGILYLGTL
jgi:hypothetical protein